MVSADPGLGHGRGRAWDHRRCGTCFLARLCLSALQLHAVCQPPPCLLMNVQVCRLPARKTHQNCPKPPKPSAAAPCRLPAAALSSYERSSLPFASPQLAQLAHACMQAAFMQLVLESAMAFISFLFSLSLSREHAIACCDMVFPMACHAWQQCGHMTAMTKQQWSRWGRCARDIACAC